MEKKIKVLQVIPKLGYGGAETGCYDLAHYLYENDCKSYIVTSGGELTKYIKKDKVTLIRLPVHSKNPILIFLNFLIISILVIFLNIKIVHARSRAPAWSCLWATKITGRKFVTTFHGTYNFSNSIKRFYNSSMVRSDLVIAGSNFIFSHINENYPEFFLDDRRKMRVIFRGINTEYYDSMAVDNLKVISLRRKWKLKEEDHVILMPGRLTSWKGQEVFIEAINILNSIETEKPFVGVVLGNDQGRKVYYKKLQSLVDKYRLSKKIIFISSCENMPAAYKLAHVVVSASVEPEAFGRVSVEAQSMRVPIIASDLGGSKEIIINEKSGFLVKGKDPKILAEKLKNVLNSDNNLLQSIGLEGRKNVLTRFDVEKMCKATLAEYKKILI